MKEPWQLVRDRRWVWSTGPGGVQAPAHLRLGSTKGPDSPGGYLSAPGCMFAAGAVGSQIGLAAHASDIWR